MSAAPADTVFTGSIPALYETYLVPLIFEPYAPDLAGRVAAHPVTRVLEIAAGTGVLTRALLTALDPAVSILATDLNPAMLAQAVSIRTAPNAAWAATDAQTLPFAAAQFEAVVCQFGAMFFPDRARAYAEARRVLKPGGYFHFSVWDRLSENEFAEAVTDGLVPVFPDDPPRFLARTPHGYADPQAVAADLAQAGFTARPAVDTVAARSVAGHPSIPAIAFCQGTPLRNEIESRDPALLQLATEAASAAVARRFGSGIVDGKMQAHIVSVQA